MEDGWGFVELMNELLSSYLPARSGGAACPCWSRLSDPLGALGMFLNLLPICSTQEQSDTAAIRTIAARLLEADSHSLFPIDLIARIAGTPRVSPVAFNFVNFHNQELYGQRRTPHGGARRELFACATVRTDFITHSSSHSPWSRTDQSPEHWSSSRTISQLSKCRR